MKRRGRALRRRYGRAGIKNLFVTSRDRLEDAVWKATPKERRQRRQGDRYILHLDKSGMVLPTPLYRLTSEELLRILGADAAAAFRKKYGDGA